MTNVRTDLARVTPLSKKSLEKVWDWADANRGNPLADAYCIACAALEEANAARHIASGLWGDEWDDCRFLYRAASSLEDKAYDHRDTIGRVILNRLKKSSKP